MQEPLPQVREGQAEGETEAVVGNAMTCLNSSGKGTSSSSSSLDTGLGAEWSQANRVWLWAWKPGRGWCSNPPKPHWDPLCTTLCGGKGSPAALGFPARSVPGQAQLLGPSKEEVCRVDSSGQVNSGQMGPRYPPSRVCTALMLICSGEGFSLSWTSAVVPGRHPEPGRAPPSRSWPGACIRGGCTAPRATEHSLTSRACWT